MKHLSIVFCAFSCLGLFAQSAPFQVLAASGAVIENGGVRMYYTVGEAFVELHPGTGYSWASGFQQPNYGIVAAHEPGAGAVRIALLPNPTSDAISWKIEGAKGSERFKWSLFSALGSFLRQGDAANAGTLDLSIFPSGNYLLLFSDEQGALLPKRFLIAR